MNSVSAVHGLGIARPDTMAQARLRYTNPSHAEPLQRDGNLCRCLSLTARQRLRARFKSTRKTPDDPGPGQARGLLLMRPPRGAPPTCLHPQVHILKLNLASLRSGCRRLSQNGSCHLMSCIHELAREAFKPIPPEQLPAQHQLRLSGFC